MAAEEREAEELTPEELAQQEPEALPSREAMSTIQPVVGWEPVFTIEPPPEDPA